MSTFFSLSGTRVSKEDNTFAPGAKVKFWEAGSSTPLAVYSDNALSSSLGAEVTCDLFGLIPAIWLDRQLYKFEVTESDDTNIFGPVDQYDADDGVSTIFIGDAGGTADALTFNTAGITELQTNRKYRGLAAYDNLTTTPTLNINGYGAKTVVRAGNVPLIPGDIQAGYVHEFVYLSGVDKFQIVGVDGIPGTNAVIPNHGIANVGLTAEIDSDALTVTLVSADGSSLSTTNAAQISFRSDDLTEGHSITRTMNANVSITLSSGSSLGFQNAVSGRIYVGAIDNDGTVELCLWNPLYDNGTNGWEDLFTFEEDMLQSTTAEGGAGGADSEGVLYSTTARTDLPFRMIGWINIQAGSTTAGTWDVAPTHVQVMGPGVPRTGDIVQRAQYRVNTGPTGSTTTPNDDTIPQITEGTQFLAQSFTAKYKENLVEFDVQATMSTSTSAFISLCLHRSGTNNALSTVVSYPISGGGAPETLNLYYRERFASASTYTYSVRIGANTGNILLNSYTIRTHGGRLASHLIIKEIFV